MKKAVVLAIIVIGITAMASQIVLVREFLTVFYGNELSVSFILAGWLIGGSLGSLFLGRFADKIIHKTAVFSACQIVLGFLFPAAVIAIRSIKIIFNINTGEIIPFFPMALSSFLILVFPCAVLGFMFTLACRLYDFKSYSGAAKIGEVYALESIGAIIGGIAASFVLIATLGSLYIMVILALVNCVSALILSFNQISYPGRRFLMTAEILIIIFFVLMWPSKGWSNIDEYSVNGQWRGYELLSSQNSIYGNVAVTKRGDQFSFFDNGLRLYTVPDRTMAEEAAHFALLEHPNPESLLLIGGGIGGLAEEAIKHPLDRITYVELDPLIIEMARRYLPEDYYGPLLDMRVSVKFTDGRYFVKTTDRKYDCVIVHLGDPYTAQINRYYTVEFFREVKHVLKKGGVLSFSVSSSENYINKELGDFLRSLYVTLKRIFADVKIIPGDTAYFIASDNNMLTYDYNILMERAGSRLLDLKYVREYYLVSKLSPRRISYMEDIVNSKGAVKINHDFRPISYYYDIIFWSSRFRDSLFSIMLKAATEARIWKIVSALYISMLVAALCITRRRKFFRESVMLTIMASGFTMMALQIIILLAFQILYGYLFYKLGLILTSFMIGLAIGAWVAVKTLLRFKNERRVFIIAQVVLCAYLLVLPLFFTVLSHSKQIALLWLGSNAAFPLFSISAGLIGGFQFALANKIYLVDEKKLGRTGGLSYGTDLLGSFAGAVLTGALLIPVLGIPKTCFFLVLTNLLVLAALERNYET